MLQRLLAALALATSLACASSPPHRPVRMELAVAGLDAAMLADAEKALKAQPEFGNVRLRSNQAGMAVFDVDYTGDVSRLDEVMARIRRPSLHHARVVVHVAVEAQDTEAPTVRILHPTPGRTLLQKKLFVVADVGGGDVKEVLINGIVTRPLRGGVYKTAVDLMEGSNEVAVAAVDTHGNRRVEKLTVTVDTTPVTHMKFKKAAVSGNGTLEDVFLVEGQPVTLFTDQTFRVEVMVPLEETAVDVIHVDKAGRVTVQRVPLGK
ncbi:MAG: hypothetical protein HY904_20650 [Deltaproteobacteria bacterium]|nr:hypothetical protein [Deltaproteobacteria bacterium]